MRYRNIAVVVLRFAAAVILLQTLYFKFTGHTESVYIFTQAGMEPWGRYLVGVLELIAGGFLLTPRYYWAGALLAAGLMAGAIVMHVTRLGIEVQGDGGFLFFLAVGVFLASVLLVLEKRKEIPLLKTWF